MRAILLAALALAEVALAQTAEDDLRSKIVALRYPPLPRAARVQGDVRLGVDSSGITVVSGPPLLRQAAIENAKSLGLPLGTRLTYHFVLTDNAPTTVPVSETVRRGDAFDRFFLRMFGLKTQKVVISKRCVPVDPPNDVRVLQGAIEAWINAGSGCLETEVGL